MCAHSLHRMRLALCAAPGDLDGSKSARMEELLRQLDSYRRGVERRHGPGHSIAMQLGALHADMSKWLRSQPPDASNQAMLAVAAVAAPQPVVQWQEHREESLASESSNGLTGAFTTAPALAPRELPAAAELALHSAPPLQVQPSARRESQSSVHTDATFEASQPGPGSAPRPRASLTGGGSDGGSPDAFSFTPPTYGRSATAARPAYRAVGMGEARAAGVTHEQLMPATHVSAPPAHAGAGSAPGAQGHPGPYGSGGPGMAGHMLHHAAAGSAPVQGTWRQPHAVVGGQGPHMLAGTNPNAAAVSAAYGHTTVNSPGAQPAVSSAFGGPLGGVGAAPPGGATQSLMDLANQLNARTMQMQVHGAASPQGGPAASAGGNAFVPSGVRLSPPQGAGELNGGGARSSPGSGVGAKAPKTKSKWGLFGK
jgi:hypothetical protein